MSEQEVFRSFAIKYPFLLPQLLTTVHVMHGSKETEEMALWDTGATVTCISTSLAEDLALVPTGMRDIKTPSGSKTVNTYLVNIRLPNNVTAENVEVCDSDIGEQGLGVLIGMNIIMQGDFSVSNFNGKTSFTFRIPSKRDANFTKEDKLADFLGLKHGSGKRKKKKKH